MVTTIMTFLRSPRQRTQAETIASGVLIVLGLAAGYIFRLDGLHDGLMIAAALIAGSDIAVRAVVSLRNRHISIELLVSIAAVGALIIGEVWEAAAVTFLFVLGANLEARTLAQTRKVLSSLLDLAPVTALVLREGRQVEVAPDEVREGETVVLKPGAKVSVDGEVIAGASAVDESMITGEPMPEEKTLGALVYAGTVNLDGMLQVRATGIGADTTLARIIARVEEAQEEKAPTQRFVEKFASWYTPAIILMSVVVYLITRNLELALTLLVIACPGALVISTPVSVIAGIGQAARRGILIKGGEYLENAGRISAVAFDKTGTITFGKPQLSSVMALQPETHAVAAGPNGNQSVFRPNPALRWNAQEQEVLFWAGLAELGSEHPLARAVTQAAEKLGELPMPDDFQTFTGKGIQAVYQHTIIQVGKPEWLLEQGVEIMRDAQTYVQDLRARGETVVVVALNGMAVGILGISDSLRSGVVPALNRLRASGVKKILMLTGDDERTARAIAQEAGIEDVRAGLLPEDKLQAVRALKQEGYIVAMVGDGINDAPALAAADVGIAMGAAGSGIAIETADIALIADDLDKVPEAISLSKATVHNIRQNLAIALITVSVLLAGVLMDEVHMAGGMLVHQASVLVVIFNGMRLLRK
jgi:Zn2+/Cd2+-exporting ATPase